MHMRIKSLITALNSGLFSLRPMDSMADRIDAGLEDRRRRLSDA